LACRDELVFSKILKMPKWVLPLFFLPLLLCWNLGSQLRAPILPGTLALAFGGLLFFCLVSPQGGFINQVFCSKVLTRLGKYSYGLYVLNQPIAFFPGNIKVFDKVIRIIHYPLAGTFIYALLAFGFTFGLAWLSWHLLEKPFLNMKKRFV